MIAGAGTKYFAISLFFSTGRPFTSSILWSWIIALMMPKCHFFIGVERILNYGRRNVSDGSPAFWTRGHKNFV